MNKNISIFKKFSLYRKYKKIIRKNSSEIYSKFNLRRDYANRIYTVMNIPQEIIEEPYNMRKTDVDKIAEGFIKEYSNGVSDYLNSKGLSEMYSFYEIKKIEKYSYLIVFGFSLMNSAKIFRNTYYRILPISVLLILLCFLIFLL